MLPKRNYVRACKIQPHRDGCAYILFEDCGRDGVLAHLGPSLSEDTKWDDWVQNVEKIDEYLAGLADLGFQVEAVPIEGLITS